MEVTLIGSFGFGNAGDEAVLFAFQDLARSIGVETNPLMLSRFDASDMTEVIDLGPQDRSRREAMQSTHGIFVGGGVVEPSKMSVLNRVCTGIDTRIFSTLSLFGVAVEPGVDFSWAWRRRIRNLASKMRYVGARDMRSYAQLCRILGTDQVPLTGDIVLALQKRPCGRPLPNKYIAFNGIPRFATNDQLVRTIAHDLVALMEETSSELVFVSMSSDHDRDEQAHEPIRRHISESRPELTNKMHSVGGLHPRELLDVFHGATVTIAARLHASVMSVNGRTPVVPLSYHPKVHGFSRTMHIDNYIPDAFRNLASSRVGVGFDVKDLKLAEGAILENARSAISSQNLGAADYYVRALKRELTSLFGAVQ